MSNTLAQAHDPVPPSDRRLYARQPIRSLAYVELDEGNGGIILNISEGGLSVQAVTSLMDDLLPGVRFQLSESEGWIEANARITWTGPSRKVAGLEFVDLPEEARSRIREWFVRENSPAGADVELGTPSEDVEPPTTVPDAGESEISTAPTAEASFVTKDRSEEHDPVASAVQIGHAIPAAPVPETNLSSMAETSASAPNQAHESDPEQAVQMAASAPHVVSRLFSNHAALATILGLLAVGSLALGWAAGQGDLGKFFLRIHPIALQNGAADRANASSSAMPVARVSEIEVVNANNQRWTIPFDGPLDNSADSARRPTSAILPSPARKLQSGFRTWILSPPQQRRAAADDGRLVKENPPVLADAPGGTESVLTSSGAINSHALAGPPTLRVPEPPPATGVVKQGQLVRRVDPSYPTLARNQRVEGTVRLNVTIGADGSVRGVAVLGGSRLLVEAAEKAVLQWRYSPTFLDGKPIEVQKEVDLRFHFTDAAR